MGLETATSISALNALWPLGTDPRSQGDDHLRLIKSVLKADVVSKKSGGTFDGVVKIDTGGASELVELGVFGGSARFTRASYGTQKINEAGVALEVGGTGSGVSSLFRGRASDGALLYDLAPTGVATFSRSGYGAVTTANAGTALLFDDAGGVGSLSSFLRAYIGGVTRFRVEAPTGDVTNANNSYGSASDARIKQDVEDAGPQLADVLALRVVNYRLKEDPDQLRQIGLIAQEVEAVKPGLVFENEQGVKGVKYSVLGPIMLKALQELAARVTDLEASGDGAAA